jgi:GH18 family chitinase
MQRHRIVVPVLVLIVTALLAFDARALENNGFTKKVLGYHLSWRPWTDPVDQIPWDHFTHFSYFAVAANADGSLGFNDNCGTPQNFVPCWTDAKFAALVAAGHARDVKVGLSLVAKLNPDGTTNTSWIRSFLKNPARNRLINNIRDKIVAAGADGVNVDIEWPLSSDASNYASFVKALASAVHAARPGSYVFVAVPAWDYPQLRNYATLAANSDGLEIMGYGYHGDFGGSEPGPVAPINAGTLWTQPPYDLNWTLNYYAGLQIPTSKLLLGFPIYGTDWPTTSASIPGTRDTSTPLRPMKFPVVKDNYPGANPADGCEGKSLDQKTDSVSQTPYRAYQENGWRQLFCEDLDSMSAKYQLAQNRGVAGVFVWAENYLPHDYPFWRLHDQYFKQTPPPNQTPAATIDTESWSGTTLTLTGSASDPDNDPMILQWKIQSSPPGAVPPVYDVSNQSTLVATLTTPGSYTIRFTASDGRATATATRTVVLP